MKFLNNLLLFVFLILSVGIINSTHTPSWINVDVQRSVDVTTALARETITIKAKSLTDNNNIYQMSFDSNYHVSIQATDSQSNELKVYLSPNSINIKDGFKTYNIELIKSIKNGEIITLKVKVTSMIGQMKPYPAEIKQGQTQLVLHLNNHYFTSPYKTETQKTVVKLASSKVESHSELQPTSLKGSTITYGPYVNIESFSVDPMRIHYENNAQFLVLTNLLKEYEVSMWGNLAVETTYHVEHKGAKLTGPFSRLDYQRNPAANPTQISEINEGVPLSAADFYYRDSIGNISTSSYQYLSNRINFKINPRFPLMGGWKNTFYTGYNLPIENFLSVDTETGLYHLNVTFGVNIENVYVENHQVKFILPEGATDIKVTAPFVFSQSMESRKTYLDTVGRPVLVLDLKDTAAENYRYVQVTFSLSSLSILHEPLLVISAVFALCVFIILYSRFDLSISKSKVI